MDDRHFDHVLKHKLESVKPAYNDQAWKALDYKLDLLAPLPWYSRWKSLLVAGSLAVITLLNIGLLYKVDNEQDQLKQLVALLGDQKNDYSPDTVYLVTENYLSPGFLQQEGGRLLVSADETAAYDLFDPLSVYRITASVNQTTAYSISQVQKQSLSSNTPLIEPDYSASLSKELAEITALDPFDDQYRLKQPNGEDMYVRGVVLPPSKRKWDHPLDPRIGVFAGYLIPDPDLGERFVSSRQSLLLETPLRGNFHLLSGISYQKLTYKLDDVDDNNFEPTTLLKYPDYGSFSSTPDEITVDNTILQIPLYFRYYKPLNHSWSVFAGGGPTIDLLLDQKFTYSFLDIRNEQLVKFDEIRNSDGVEVTLGSFSGNMGVEHFFNQRLSAQVELNYQYGLGKLGIEGRSFNSFTVSGGLFYKLNNHRNR
ncbi:MAG: hypothetical protein DHS20C17_07600 [Cyclobacteriaceae bacterium]|nr:MAG: hypothetical protein DHS20C17_07600 [Cyclobacteriaceae bacterium]